MPFYKILSLTFLVCTAALNSYGADSEAESFEATAVTQDSPGLAPLAPQAMACVSPKNEALPQISKLKSIADATGVA